MHPLHCTGNCRISAPVFSFSICCIPTIRLGSNWAPSNEKRRLHQWNEVKNDAFRRMQLEVVLYTSLKKWSYTAEMVGNRLIVTENIFRPPKKNTTEIWRKFRHQVYCEYWQRIHCCMYQTRRREYPIQHYEGLGRLRQWIQWKLPVPMTDVGNAYNRDPAVLVNTCCRLSKRNWCHTVKQFTERRSTVHLNLSGPDLGTKSAVQAHGEVWLGFTMPEQTNLQTISTRKPHCSWDQLQNRAQIGHVYWQDWLWMA